MRAVSDQVVMYRYWLFNLFGKNTIGVLWASDRAPGLRVAVSDKGFGQNAQFNIGRYQRDVLLLQTLAETLNRD